MSCWQDLRWDSKPYELWQMRSFAPLQPPRGTQMTDLGCCSILKGDVTFILFQIMEPRAFYAVGFTVRPGQQDACRCITAKACRALGGCRW